MSELTRQQLCAALSISESTVRRLERHGMPFTGDGRDRRYSLDAVKAWSRAEVKAKPPQELPTTRVMLPDGSLRVQLSRKDTEAFCRTAIALSKIGAGKNPSEAKKRAAEAHEAKWNAIAAAGPMTYTVPAPPPPPTKQELQAMRAQERREAEQRAWDAMERRAGIVRFHASKRRAARLQRTPPWADLEAMRAIYAEAQALTINTGIAHHVDHVIPLQGKLVSGLHVHNNLQILTGSENSRKRNHFEVEA